jgi:Pentapeptide repeats (8 copies)
MTGAIFTNAIFYYTTLKGAIFTNAIFIDADLSGEGVEFNESDFTGANLTRANLTGATLTGVTFTDANFSGANLSEAELSYADFSGANLTRAMFNEANLTGADLTGADLTGADLTGADLTGANLTGAELTEVDLTESDLTESDSETDLSETDSTRTDLTNEKTPDLKLSPSYKAIARDQIGFHIFDMEVQVLEYLKSTEGIDAIAFLYYSTYYLINKSTLAQLIDTRSRINSVEYSQGSIPLMKVESTGIPLRFSYIHVSYIKHILTKTSNKIEDRMFELVSTGEEVDMDYDRGRLFKLKKIKNAGDIVLNTIRRAASANKTKKSLICSYDVASLGSIKLCLSPLSQNFTS